MAVAQTFPDIRAAVARLCAGYGGDYWRRLDADRLRTRPEPRDARRARCGVADGPRGGRQGSVDPGQRPQIGFAKGAKRGAAFGQMP